MVGSDLLDGFGIIDYNSVIGKKITYNTKLFNNCSIDEDGKIDTYDIKVKKNDEYNDLTEEYIEYSYDVFSDFVIVGVFNSNIYKCPSRCSVYSPNGEIYNYSRFWFKEEAISKIYYEYELVYDSYEDEYYEKYDSLVFEDELKNILDTTNGFRIIIGKEITNPINQTYYLQFNDIESLYNFYNEIVGYEISNYFEINYSVKAYLDFLPTYKTLKSILTILLLILVLLIIMNLIRTLDYSIHRKMDFYIMLKNIGLEYKNIIGIYYCSILGNYLMSVLVSANLFIPLSIIHYNVTKNVLSNYGNWIIFDINIWGYFIIFIFVVFLLLFMFSMVAIMILLIYKKKFKKGVLSND